MGMYYNTIIGWAVYYLFASMRSELPWTSCENSWNTPYCALVTSNFTGEKNTTPAKEFFECVYFFYKTLIYFFKYITNVGKLIKLECICRRSVLEKYKSDGLDHLGPIKWSLALCVLTVFLLVYFSLWKGVRSTGKVSKYKQN